MAPITVTAASRRIPRIQRRRPPAGPGGNHVPSATPVSWSQLHTFVALAETGSVRAAAGRLSVTESAASASLSAMQRSLGMSLVTRAGRGLQLTAAGVAYAEYARRILGLLDEARVAAASVDSPTCAPLRIGAVATAGEYVVPALLASFRERYPDIGISVEIGVRARLRELFADHGFDIMIGGRPPPGSGAVSRARRDNSLVVVAAPERLDAASVPWLLREPGSGTREAALALLATLDISPATLTLGTPGAVVAACVHGLGVGLVSCDAVRRELADRSLAVVAVRGTPLTRPWHVITPRRRTPTAELFLRHVCDPAEVGELAFRSGARVDRTG
jgi:DNA-binding transcriptional LysR family regulator